MEVRAHTVQTGGVIYSEAEVMVTVPAHADPLTGSADPAVPRMVVVSRRDYREAVLALLAAPLGNHRVVVADIDGIGWRTGHRTGGRTEPAAAAGAADPAPEPLRALAVALGRVHEAPLGNAPNKEVHLLWNGAVAAPPPHHHDYHPCSREATDPAPIAVEAFELFRQEFERCMPASAHDDPRIVVHYTDTSWGTVRFNEHNSEACHQVVQEARRFVDSAAAEPRPAGAAMSAYEIHRLRAALSEGEGVPVLALAVLALARDRGARFAPMASPRAVLQAMYGQIPASSKQHHAEMELWPVAGDGVSGATLLAGQPEPGLQFAATGPVDRHCRVALRASGDPGREGRGHRIRLAVDVHRAAVPQRKSLLVRLWSVAPPDQRVSIVYLTDMSHRSAPGEHRVAASRRGDPPPPLPEASADLLLRVHAGLDALGRARSQTPAAAREVFAAQAAAFCRTLEPPPDHPVSGLQLAAQSRFAAELVCLQQRLQDVYSAEHDPDTPRGGAPKRARTQVTLPQRMSSMGQCLSRGADHSGAC